VFSVGDAPMAGGVHQNEPKDDSPPPRASDSQIHKMIAATYDDAKVAGTKPPNVKQVAVPVQEKLREAGYEASQNRITHLAGDKRHDGCRRPPGKTIKSEQKRRL
jgi:hypothetical protein